MNKNELEEFLPKIQEQLAFYQNMADSLPALVYMNTFIESGNPFSLRNVWCNKFALDFLGYSQSEISELGFEFFTQIMHPDDIEIIKRTADVSASGISSFQFLQRLRPKACSEYYWMYGGGVLSESYENGLPKSSLNVVMNISDQMHTENQLVASLKEINKLKNELSLHSLTKREKEILSCISKGCTDREIASKLNISVATAQTHRNKIIRKLELKNTASLVAFAVECGY
jgi:DNA-binding CsgD family transcriptional regulator